MNKFFKTILSAIAAITLTSGLTACNDSDSGVGTFTDTNIFTPQSSMTGVVLRFDKTSSVIPTNSDQILTAVPYLFNSEKQLRALASYSYEVNADEPTMDTSGRLRAQVLAIDSICTTNAIVAPFSSANFDKGDSFNLNTNRYTFIADGFLNIHYEIYSDGTWNDRKNGSPDFILMADAENPGNFELCYYPGSHKGSSVYSYVASFDISRVPGIQNVKNITVRYNNNTLKFELGENGIFGATAPSSNS
ncbi:MAG: hypothetical protein K2K40_09555 [Paramuribaculum sp.]|nr:hypothetical protein [Paramuribaculum sp.]